MKKSYIIKSTKVQLGENTYTITNETPTYTNESNDIKNYIEQSLYAVFSKYNTTEKLKTKKGA